MSWLSTGRKNFCRSRTYIVPVPLLNNHRGINSNWLMIGVAVSLLKSQTLLFEQQTDKTAFWLHVYPKVRSRAPLCHLSSYLISTSSLYTSTPSLSLCLPCLPYPTFPTRTPPISHSYPFETPIPSTSTPSTHTPSYPIPCVVKKFLAMLRAIEATSIFFE